jgi:hypothetical protein
MGFDRTSLGFLLVLIGFLADFDGTFTRIALELVGFLLGFLLDFFLDFYWISIRFRLGFLLDFGWISLRFLLNVDRISLRIFLL